MSIMGVTYSIRGCWQNDMEHPAEIADQFVALLDRVEAVVPVKTVWLLFDFADVDIHAGPDAEPPVNVLLTDAREDMASFVERNDFKDEDGSTDPQNGYLLVARGTEDGSEVGSSKSIGVTATVGSRWDNEIKFEVGSLVRPADPALVTYPVYKGGLEAMISAFPCPFAWAGYSIFTEAVWIPQPSGSMLAAPGEPSQPFDGVWIAYLSAPLAAGLTPPPELYPERTPSGGLILSAVKDHIDPTNPDHVRRSVMLRDIMIKQIVGASDRVGFALHDFPPRVGPY